MKRRTLSIFLMVALLFCALPFSAAAVQTISAVEVTGLSLPEAGQALDLAVSVGASCSVYDVEWYDVTTQSYLESSDRFVLNHAYKAIIWVEAKNGYEFDYTNSYTPKVTATVDGEDATVTKAYEYSAWAMVCVEYSFSTCPIDWIESVEATVIPPVAGTPLVHSVSVPANAKYEVQTTEPSISTHYYRFYNGIQWNIEFQSGVLEGTTAQLGKWYCATVLLKPKAGYAFLENGNITATINGKNATITYHMSDANLLEFGYSGFETFGRIPAFNVEIVEPVVGECPYFYALAQVSNVVVQNNNITWIDRTANKYMGAYDVFEAGHEYEIFIEIIPATGYRFVHDFGSNYVTVNHTSADVGSISAIDEGIRIYKTYILEAEPPTPTPAVNPFIDVKSTDYYYSAVLWAVGNNITAGTSANKFSPAMKCDRGQVVTFLWRAAGCPEPSSLENPFTDVKSTDYYYKAVLWAVEEGITGGTGGGKFSPNMTCDRAQIVTFLYRFAGKPAVSGSNPFTDIKSTDYYYNAVLWAVSNNITAGTAAGKFSPNMTCDRGQVVTFLYRLMK